ncbi:hypothetical protein HYPSUDRAFT_62652 [Hypholoma sublateritium FD-334 SS-4]|uniref:DUF7726 domain-containing protein n=1 Tax=Hypholoma sublateritium (strain FD-334 SS-4) TaxID=945553 RepID=A0A0D2LIW0_HYPSF|nr:hypothetical protein HYPSUDRAFT_62652 [Hypholoma sublateritium FD-334 SS-4]
MAPKRKGENWESTPLYDLPRPVIIGRNFEKYVIDYPPADDFHYPPAKKARLSDAPDASASSSVDKDASKSKKPTSWRDITLPGEDEGDVPIYDDCGEVRRKIRLLQKTPGWKVTQWLRDIGGINSNSYGRFMREKGRTDGAANGTYYAAYVYFEKVRIFEGKKKSAKRQEMENTHIGGASRDRPQKYIWARV